MIGIIDYGVGNIKAFANVYKRLNMDYRIVSEASQFTDLTRIILPGVGSFDYAMTQLEQSGMRPCLDEAVLEKKLPVLGICIGMQMLAKSSEEGSLPGLGWIQGHVKKLERIEPEMPLPHMGWNDVAIKKASGLFEGLNENPRFYFLHSYYFVSEEESDVLAVSRYGKDFTCIVQHENVYGIQCHPEKSHDDGMTLLKNFGVL